MFLVDKFGSKIVSNPNHMDKTIKAIKVKEDISKEKYLYIVEKISISILILFISLGISSLLYIREQNQNSKVKAVKRDNQYNLLVKKSDGETTEITIDVPKRELSENEKDEILKSAEKDLLNKILGENENLNNVCHKLNLVNSIGEEQVVVFWNIQDESLINDEGYIGDNIPKEGQVVQLEATLMLEDKMRQVIFSTNVYPSKDKKDIENYLQEFVEENDVYKEEVILPETIEKHTVQYYMSVENLNAVIVIVGIILSFAIFFLKDKDMDKEIKERNKQLIKDYPEIVSKILLFYGAGLSIKMAFEEIVKEYEKEKKRNKDIFRYAYEEMIITLNKMRTGIPDRVAIGDYGKRCGIHCYIKLANIIEQNLKRGTREITYALKEELTIAVNERKNSALKEGNEISTKLLGPMLIMLMVAIVIVIVPAFLSMNF